MTTTALAEQPVVVALIIWSLTADDQWADTASAARKAFTGQFGANATAAIDLELDAPGSAIEPIIITADICPHALLPSHLEALGAFARSLTAQLPHAGVGFVVDNYYYPISNAGAALSARSEDANEA